jgi:anti-anti-sigma factor
VKNVTFGFECDHWMQSSPDTLLVYIRGQMVNETLDATEGCWQAVRHAFRRSVVLDLSQVTYMASAALGSLCGLRRWLMSQGSGLRIVAISTEVRSIMEASG